MVKFTDFCRFFFIVVFLFGAQPFYSQENPDENEEQTVSAESTEKTDSSLQNHEVEKKQLTKEEKEEAKKREKLEKAAAKLKAMQRTDKYLGIVYLPQKKYTLQKGKLKLTFKASNGTYNVYALDSKGKSTAVFSKYEDSTSTSLFVKAGETAYRLNKDAGVDKSLRKTADGVQLAYTVEKTVQVVEDYHIFSARGDEECDSVKVTVYVTNIGDKKSTFAVKKVFDTILGEGGDFHFTTSDGEKIYKETQYSDFKKQKALVSRNGNISLDIVLSGETVSDIQRVLVSNMTNLLKSPWIPVSVSDRSFHSIAAYNNSGVAVNWNELKLEKGETASFVYYLGIGFDGEKSQILNYLDSLKTPENEKNEEKSDETSIPHSEKTVEATAQRTAETPASNSVQNEIRKTDVDFILPPVTERQLDPEYIQQLINKINSLQSDPKTVDRQEVRQLSAELDAILSIVRQQNNNE